MDDPPILLSEDRVVIGNEETPLEHPDEQLLRPRLAGAGSLRRELEAALAAAPAGTPQETYRSLIIDANVVGKASASSRTWAWKRLKLRYILDPRVPEFHAFETAIRVTSGVSDRGLLCLLMLARSDRLFREVTLEEISPMLHQPDTEVKQSAVLKAIVGRQQAGGFDWSEETLKGIRSHLLSALKDCGVVYGSRTKRTYRPAPGPIVAVFAAQLARLEGLSDRQILEACWFRLLGLDRSEVVELMYAATRERVLGFRMQADVVELSLPSLEVASA